MNKLLLLLVVLVFLVAGVLVMNVGSSDNEESVSIAQSEFDVVRAPEQTVSTLSAAEKDTYVNTIQTMSAQYGNLEKEFQELINKQKTDMAEVPTDTEISRTVGDRVTESAEDLRRDFHEQLKELRAGLEKKIKQPKTTQNDGIPNGLGFDDLMKPRNSNGRGTAGTPTMNTMWSTVMPIGTESNAGANSNSKIGGGVLDWYAKKTSPNTQDNAQPVRTSSKKRSTSRNVKEEDPMIPAHTIPRNATLFDNNTMTALLGVIPVEGSILDPIRFKVITGQTNMATNGLYIPGVRNIVWSGIAVGNREMSCVRGELHSVTFTFEDGTIRTVSSNSSTSNTKLSGNKKILGYISDRQGSPCLRGLLITNASDYLKDRMIASGVAATADASAETQKTTVVSSTGSMQSFFSGDSSKYIGARALSGGLKELSEYMRERQRNAVDIVFLEAGQQVVLHVEDQIEIDYDPNGRKLEYANALSSLATNSHRLD